MRKRSTRHIVAVLAIFGVLAVALILLPSIALGVTPTVSSAKTTYLLGETVSLPAAIEFIQGEALDIESVTLNITGPQSVSQAVPVAPGSYTFPSKYLTVGVSWQNIGLGYGYGYVNGYGYGYGYKGTGSPARIAYDIKWNPPFLLDPQPVFTLLPQTTEAFVIPSPDVPPTPTPGGPTELPSFFDVFAIPQFEVPGLPADAPPELPTPTELFAIPQLSVPSPPAGVSELPTTGLAFNLPTPTSTPRAMAASGTSTFYVLVDGEEGQPDKILTLSILSITGTSTATTTNSFDAPSDSIEGIAFLNNLLWVADNYDPTFTGKRIRKLNKDTGAEVSSFSVPVPNQYDDIGGIGAEGSGSSGTLWLARKNGCGFIKVSQSGSKQTEVMTSCSHAFESVFVKGSSLYVAHGGMVMKFNQQGQEQTSWNVDQTDLRGAEIVTQSDGDVIYLLDAETFAVYKTTFPIGITISKNPRGIAFDGTNYWLLLDATPSDKLVKVNSSGTELANYNAPGAQSTGITYLGTSLWIATNDNNQPKVHQVNPSTGGVSTSVNIPGYVSVGDLTNDGTNLMAVDADYGSVVVFDTQGNQVLNSYIGGASFSGATGFAWDTVNGRSFIGKTGKVGKTDANFYTQEEWNTGLLDIQGLFYKDNILYIADAGSKKVYRSTVPLDVNVSTDPRGMAYDGTSLWILVDGNPFDKVLKVNPSTGALDSEASFNATSNQADAITYVGGKLYIANNITDPCCSRKIVRHSPATGAEEASFNTPGYDDVAGLTTDGTLLFAGSKTYGGGVQSFSTTGQNAVSFYLDGMYNGMGALAYYAAEDHLFAFRDNAVRRFQSTGGPVIQEWTDTNVADAQGATFVGNLIYVADADTNHVFRAAIPVPPVTTSNTPKGMTSDGTNLYIVVDGSPKDKIIKVTTGGTLLDSFDAPGNNVDAIDYFGGFLYVAVNDSPSGFFIQPKVHKLNKDTGAKITNFQVPGVNSPIAALANDGTKLIVGQQYDGKWILVDPASPSGATDVFQQYGSFPYMPGFGSLLFALNNLYGVGSGAGGGAGSNVLNKFNKTNGNPLASTALQPSTLNITGLAYMGTTLYLAHAGSGIVYASTFSDNQPEKTIAGSYTAMLVLQTGGVGFESAVASFTLQKITQVLVNITAPENNFASTTTQVLVTGYINDPAISSVLVGIDLPFLELFKDTVSATSTDKYASVTGLWHVACKTSQDQGFPKAASYPCAWYYGKDDTQNYDTGGTNSGNLRLTGPNSNGTFTVDNADFTFQTWWDTEAGAQSDRKMVQVSTNGGTSWQTIAMILAPWDINPGTNQPWFVPDDLVGLNIQYIPINQADFSFGPCPPNCFFGQPKFNLASVDLSAYQSQDILIRFRFDSVNEFFNFPQGWFIDDVEITGASFLGQTATTTPVTDATQNAAGIYATFSSSFNMAEGLNIITARATNPYNLLVGLAQVQGMLDTTAPQVVLAPIQSPTASSSVTVSGNALDLSFKTLVLTQTTAQGSKILLTKTSLPSNGAFSVNAALVSGDNTFEATATDGAGLSGSASLLVVADQDGPTITLATTTYPVGFISARMGDPVIFNVTATDTISGVDHIEIVFPGGGNNSTSSVGMFIPASQIPAAVRDLWSATGQWIMPIKVPSNAPPGTLTMTIFAVDKAGNRTAGTVSAKIVPALEAFIFYLMPDWNLKSLPLIPNVSSIATSTMGVAGIESIWYYDATLTSLAPEDRWLLYTPSTTDVDTLTTFKTGRGYWFDMDPLAFATSSPLASGLPPTPKPIKFVYFGKFLEPGTLPSSYIVKQGWNSIGFHSENSLPVPTYLQTLESPVRIWGSLLQYNNRIVFELPDDPTEDPEFQILLGAFQRLLSTDKMTPGFGYWAYMVADGVIVP